MSRWCFLAYVRVNNEVPENMTVACVQVFEVVQRLLIKCHGAFRHFRRYLDGVDEGIINSNRISDEMSMYAWLEKRLRLITRRLGASALSLRAYGRATVVVDNLITC